MSEEGTLTPEVRIGQLEEALATETDRLKKLFAAYETQEKELVDNFASRISGEREAKGWSQQELGKRMAETVNVIKSAESGKAPTDSVVRKFERVLGISLMEFSSPDETSRIIKGSKQGMTLGDYFNQNGD